MDTGNFLWENDMPYIDQRTIECDMRKFTRWLNDLAELVNYLKNYAKVVKETLADHEKRITYLEDRMDKAETRIKKLEECCEEVKKKFEKIENKFELFDQAFNMLNGRIDWIYDHLPTVYGNVPADWKFAMGNINVMSDNNSTPSINGAGIYTSMSIEDNDIYFN